MSQTLFVVPSLMFEHDNFDNSNTPLARNVFISPISVQTIEVQLYIINDIFDWLCKYDIHVCFIITISKWIHSVACKCPKNKAMCSVLLWSVAKIYEIKLIGL